MSSFQISNFTLAGAYVSAVTTADESDRRNTARHSGSSDGPRRLGFFTNLVRRIVTVISKSGLTALRLASRQV